MDQPEAGARPERSPALVVSTPVFEGPLELLLALAEREELDILEVSLAELTDGYVGAVMVLSDPDPREMADFLWLGSRLLLLKSIRLLPGEHPDEEETDLLGWEEDVRRRLEEYRAYKEMAEDLMRRADEEQYAFPPPARTIEVEGQEEPLEVAALLTAFQSVLARIPPRPLEFKGRNWTPEEKMLVLEDRIARGPVDFIALLLDSEDRLEAVITFVAMLELLRRGRLRLRQKQAFGEIWLEGIS
jgi:segregation and condensation protein A